LHYSTLLIFLSQRFATCLGISNFNNLVERAPVPLLGLVLVCSGRKIMDFQVLILGKSCGWGVVCVMLLGVSSGFPDLSAKQSATQ